MWFTLSSNTWKKKSYSPDPLGVQKSAKRKNGLLEFYLERHDQIRSVFYMRHSIFDIGIEKIKMSYVIVSI